MLALTRTSIALVVPLTIALTVGANWREGFGKRNLERMPSTVDVPPKIDFDPLQNVGRGLINRKLTKLVESMSFEDPYPSTIAAEEQGKSCDLNIRAASNSQNISAKADVAAGFGYVVAVIENATDCKPLGFPLGKGERAAWIIRFDNEYPATGRVIVGTAQIVVLGKHAWNSDDWLPQAGYWRFWQCGNSHAPETKGRAMMQNQPGSICDVTKLDHDPVRIERELKGLAAKGLLTDGDPAVWFACGTDCCYSDLTKL